MGILFRRINEYFNYKIASKIPIKKIKDVEKYVEKNFFSFVLNISDFI